MGGGLRLRKWNGGCVVEELVAEPKEFGWAEALGEAISKHVVCSNVHGTDLFCFVKEAHVVGFERYMP